MQLLHPTMIIGETPLSELEIEQYLEDGIVILGNEDFEFYIEKHGLTRDYFLASPLYDVYELL